MIRNRHAAGEDEEMEIGCRTRVTGVGIGLSGALGDVQVIFASNLVVCVFAAAEELAGVAVAVEERQRQRA